MVAKRIIACLDIKGGRTVKGTQFVDLRDMGDPVELSQRYSDAGIDELVFLDISATNEERSTTVELVERISKVVSIPFTVGGGVSSINDVSRLLSSGADKVSINSAAVRDPNVINELAREFGSQCIVVAIDSKRTTAGDEVFIQAGRRATGLDTLAWAQEVVHRGAGELLVTSMDHDGVRHGFAIELTRSISCQVPVPVIASGGAGEPAHFAQVFTEGCADGALAAGIFHEGSVTVAQVKECVAQQGVEVRR